MNPHFIVSTHGLVASGTSASTVIPANAPVGSTAIFMVEVDGNVTLTPTGCVLMGTVQSPASTLTGAVYRHEVASGEPGVASMSVSWTGAQFRQSAIVVVDGTPTGVDPQSVGTSSASSTSGTTATANSITPADTRTLICALAINIDGGSHSSSFGTNNLETNCFGFFSAPQAAAAATGNKTILLPVAGWAAFLMAFKPKAPVASVGTYFTWPNYDVGASATSAASAWGAGSFVDLLPIGWDFDIALAGMEFRQPAAPALTTTYQALLEIATGDVGSEVVIAQIPLTFGDVTAVGYIQGDPQDVAFPEPIQVAAGVRISARVSDSHTAGLVYTGVKPYFEELTTSGGSTPVSGTDVNSTTTEAATLTVVISGTDADGTPVEAIIEAALYALSDANATPVENGNVTVPVSASDVNGTTTEAVTEIVAYALSDTNGSTTENNNLTVPLTVTDANATPVENGTIRLIGVDINGTTTENGAVSVPVSGSDSNGSIEASSLAAAESSSDSNSSSEISSLQAAYTGSDSNTSSDTSTLKAVFTVTDFNGSGENAFLGAVLPVSDANSSTGEVGVLALNYIVTDTGSDSEASTLTVVITTSDSGSDNEIGSVPGLPTNITGSDSGSGSDANVLHAAASSSDSAGDTESASKGLVASDAGSGAETASERVLYALSDAGNGADTATEVARYVLADLGGAGEFTVISATFVASDSSTDFEDTIKAYTVIDFGVGFDNSPVSSDRSVTGTEIGYGEDDTLITKWPYFPDEPPEIITATGLDPAVLVSSGRYPAELVATRLQTPREVEINVQQKPSITRVGTDKPRIERTS